MDRKIKKVFRKVLMVMFVFNVCLGKIESAYGNNVRISGEPDVQLNATSDSLSLTFTLSWDNSWRDNFNWDAVWLFVKYKKEGSTEAWSHLYLGGTQVGTSVLDIEPGNTGSQVVGAFVYPKKKGTFQIAGEHVTLKAPLNGLSASDISDKKVYFAVSAIEMVLIPYGAYYLGDGVSHLAFCEAYCAERNPIHLNGYRNLRASSIHSNQNASLPINAIDNNIGSHYHSAGNSEEWFMVDFGMRKEMRYFTIRTHYGGTGYFLEGSNDMNIWSVLWSGSGSDWSQTLSKHEITNPGAYQYYRFRETGNYLVIYDVALWEDDVPTLWVDSESELYYSISKNSLTEKLQIPATYPKGYKGFYIMKYELSQEQYCNFLNMLSYTQQKSRIGNNLDNLKRGDYAFGDTKRPSCRNGIAVFSHKGTSQPVVFGCNLNPVEPFFAADDGQTVACNYMTGADMLSYLDWSGLRPMSELEYEKACRTPNRVVPGEYAWNTVRLSKLGGQGGLSAATLGTEDEMPVSANINANSGAPSFGPVRCGSFGTSSTNQEQSGGSFYGAMEMSGNLGEMCYSVTGGSSLNTSSSNNEYHGDGVLAADGNYNVVTYWNRSNDATALSVRGGSFASPDSLLRLSDRSVTMPYSNTLRDSTVTFRGVRSVGGNVNPGEIGSNDSCPGLITIHSIKEATADCDLSYLWYVKRPGSSDFELIPGKKSSTLNDFDCESVGTASTITYVFRRKVVTLTDEAYVDFTLTVPNMLWEINLPVTEIDACNNSDKLIANTKVSGATYEWKYNGTILSTKDTYVPSRSVFGDNLGSYYVECHISRDGCSSHKEVNVLIKELSVPQIFRVCGDNVVDCEGNIYPTVQIGSQCWMGKNMNIGAIVQSSDFNTHNTAGIQKICYDNNPDNCESHGGLYTKEETMNGPNAGQINYVPGTLIVQGICPDGWHLPSSSEFAELSKVNNSVGLWNAVLGGCRNYNNAGFGTAGIINKQGIWWVSDNSTTVYYLNEGSINFGTSSYAYSWGLSVRCLLNK